MIPNTKTLVRLWAAILSDYEVCIGRFLNQPGWTFRHFSDVARTTRLPLIMNLAIGQGKFKVDHYEVVSRLIFDSARFFWLRAVATIDDKKLDKKRRLAGFYLTYLLYFKQPHGGQAKIYLDSEELEMVKKFINEMDTNAELRLQLMFMLDQLVYCEAFVPGATSVEHGAENWRRTLLTIQKSEVVELSFSERNVLDQFVYGTTWNKMVTNVFQYAEGKRNLVQQLLGCKAPSQFHFWYNGRESRSSILGLLLEGHTLSDSTKMAVRQMEKMSQKPILTLEQLTLDQIIERRIMSEFRQRLQRCRKRIIDGPQKPKREYVKAGSIWGRKKEVEEGEQHRQRRERGGFSRNLWVYLNDLPFNYTPVEVEENTEAGTSGTAATSTTGAVDK